MVDGDFCPGCYAYRGVLEIDGLFWEELVSGGEYKFDRQGFNLPEKDLRKNWPGVLYSLFLQTEGKFIDYDPSVVGLPSEITPEMMEEENAGTPEDYLALKREGLGMRISNFKNLRKTFPNLKEPEFIEFEERVMNWSTNYGFLVPSKINTCKSPILHPVPGIFECRREYLFHVPPNMYAEIEDDEFGSLGRGGIGYWSGILLSLGWEPNTNRCIWGFRKDFTTEFSKEFPKGFVEAMNYLTINLEGMLKGE